MKRGKKLEVQWFSELDAMGWAVSAYLATLRAMDSGAEPDRSDFGERFCAEMQARVFLAAHRKGFLCDIETPWNLPLLASFADPAFSASELNSLPGTQNPRDNAGIGGAHGG